MAKNKDIIVKKRGGSHSSVKSSKPKPSPKEPVPEETPQLPDPSPEKEETGPAKKKKRRRRSTFLRIAFRLLLVAALLVAGFLVWRNWETVAPEGLVLWLEERFSGGDAGGGFPVEITGSDISAMMPVGRDVALLSDTSLMLYNSRGGQIASRSHGYAKVLMETAGDYILLAEKEGTRFRLETRSATLLDVPSNNLRTENGQEVKVLDIPLSNKIVAATVNDEGTMAFITESSQSHMSEVAVYDRKGKRLYYRQNADRLVVDAAFSPDGKQLALIGISPQEGAIRSSVMIFDLQSTSSAPVKEYSDTDVMLFRVDYFPNGTLAALGDTATWVMNPAGTLFEKHSYEDEELLGFATGDSAVALVLRQYGNTDGGQLLVINPTGDAAYRASFGGTFRHIAAGKNGFCLLTAEELLYAGQAGFEKSIEVPADGRLVSPLGNKVVVMGLTMLSEYSLD